MVPLSFLSISPFLHSTPLYCGIEGSTCKQFLPEIKLGPASFHTGPLASGSGPCLLQVGDLAASEVNGWKSLTNLSNSCLRGPPPFLSSPSAMFHPCFFFFFSPLHGLFAPLLLCTKSGMMALLDCKKTKKLQEFLEKFFTNKWFKAGRTRRRENRRENEVLKIPFSPSISLRPSLFPFSNKKNKKRPSTGYVFHFKTKVQRHREIWVLCGGLRVMMRE